jgi:hypothetical protein
MGVPTATWAASSDGLRLTATWNEDVTVIAGDASATLLVNGVAHDCSQNDSVTARTIEFDIPARVVWQNQSVKVSLTSDVVESDSTSGPNAAITNAAVDISAVTTIVRKVAGRNRNERMDRLQRE